ncbi:MAG TPA: hypothetical protein VHC86_00760 [Opitutaceae bacterium]|nr:hypothetical protein [Opitutaceae bacterium]
MRLTTPLRLAGAAALLSLRLARAEGTDTGVLRLVAALQAQEQPRGCWAYTVTERRSEKGVATVDVARFNPSQPDPALWTLLSHNGAPPDDAQQASYRRKKLAWWHQQEGRHRQPDSDRVAAELRHGRKPVLESAPKGAETTFGWERPGRSLLVMHMGEIRESFALDSATGRLVRHVQEFPGPSSTAGLRIDYSRAEVDYGVVDPAYAPFVLRTSLRGRYHFLGSDSGDVSVEKTFSEYRRVRCYQDRFEVRIGPAQVLDDR